MKAETIKKENQNRIINPVTLRAYDIRGEVGSQLQIEDAFYIGKAFATKVIRKTKNKKPSIAVGFDGRLSSPEIRKNLIEGILESGAKIVAITLGASPMLYFSVKKYNLDAGIMITGSHNPKNHNGFKMMYNKAPLFGEEIQEIGVICKNADYENGSGSIEEIDVREEYLNQLLNSITQINSDFLKNMRIAWDSGNGAAGEIVSKLVKKIPAKHFLINEKIDGNFPAHHPDPTVAENLVQLIDLVRENNCDFGIAFDGDGDRIGAVDGKGRIIWGDKLLTFFADDIISENKNATIIADVKASQTFFDKVVELGGKPVMWKTGHSFIKQKLAETGALLAGEMSGHIFFADKNYGYDDAIYAATRLIDYFAKNKLKASDAYDKLPNSFSTEEYRISVSEEAKIKIVADIKEKMLAEKSPQEINEIDGVRIKETELNGWWLLRSSNTQNAISIRAEATSEENLEEIKSKISNLIKPYGVSLVNSSAH
ncbi:MAG: phosphomannomutase/phosphoglucomutase [Rickettsiales bacterium]|nr:phosphomannomutase/phosphoglucomutase [Rickettsiales bacterium]